MWLREHRYDKSYLVHLWGTEVESKSGLSLRTRLDMNDRRHKGYATRRMQVLEWRMGARCKGAVVVSAALNMMHETRNV